MPQDSDPLLTDALRRWAEERGHERAFTFVAYPDAASRGVHRTVSWARLDARARTVAAHLQRTCRRGERAALLLPQGLDYVVAFLGCLYARVIAVPLFTPELPGHEGRLAAVTADCEPACVLTDTPTRSSVRDFLVERGMPELPLLRVDELADEPDFRPTRADHEDIAYLQYTSGSTRTPAGVMISHANVVANARQALDAFDARPGHTTTVGWLPLFHDMGLVLSVAAPIVGGLRSALMDPVAFLEDPSRWLKLLSGYPGTVSAAPNFAFDYTVRRVAPQEAAGLRLGRVKGLINGSEPVRPGTLERFADAFAGAGLRPEAHCPSYGLAEATVFVAADPYTDRPRTVECDAEALAGGRIAPADEHGRRLTLVACGLPVGQQVRICDPETGALLPEGEVGEIRLHGPNIGLGYWKQSERSAETFGSPVPGEPGEWLHTGDLGALQDGALLVTGRLKDLLVVDGRNHYPQDVEETVQSAIACVRRDRLAAFCAPAPNPDTTPTAHAPEAQQPLPGGEIPEGAAPDPDLDPDAPEELVLVAEHRSEHVPDADAAQEALREARTAVSRAHGLRLARLLLVRPGEVPRTSSGKVSRAATRAAYLRGEFGPAHPADDAPEAPTDVPEGAVR